MARYHRALLSEKLEDHGASCIFGTLKTAAQLHVISNCGPPVSDTNAASRRLHVSERSSSES
jgi:hypothetical protein